MDDNDAQFIHWMADMVHDHMLMRAEEFECSDWAAFDRFCVLQGLPKSGMCDEA